METFTKQRSYFFVGLFATLFCSMIFYQSCAQEDASTSMDKTDLRNKNILNNNSADNKNTAAVTTNTQAVQNPPANQVSQNNKNSLPATAAGTREANTTMSSAAETRIQSNTARSWIDVTTDEDGNPSDCETNPNRCTRQDSVTGLWIAPAIQGASVNSATTACGNMDRNGKTGWQLISFAQAKELCLNNPIPDIPFHPFQHTEMILTRDRGISKRGTKDPYKVVYALKTDKLNCPEWDSLSGSYGIYEKGKYKVHVATRFYMATYGVCVLDARN